MMVPWYNCSTSNNLLFFRLQTVDSGNQRCVPFTYWHKFHKGVGIWHPYKPWMPPHIPLTTSSISHLLSGLFFCFRLLKPERKKQKKKLERQEKHWRMPQMQQLREQRKKQRRLLKRRQNVSQMSKELITLIHIFNQSSWKFVFIESVLQTLIPVILYSKISYLNY